MTVNYSFPEAMYKTNYIPLNADDICITEPQGANLSKTTAGTNGQASSATFRLDTGSQLLTEVVVTITLTRLQKNVTGADAVTDIYGQIWTWENNTSQTPAWEGKWTRDSIHADRSTTFTINFNVGTSPGTYIVTFGVSAFQFNQTVTQEITFTVT